MVWPPSLGGASGSLMFGNIGASVALSPGLMGSVTGGAFGIGDGGMTGALSVPETGGMTGLGHDGEPTEPVIEPDDGMAFDWPTLGAA